MEYTALTLQELDHLQRVIARLDARPPGDAGDRRLHPRIDFSHPMWLNLPGAAGRPWVHVHARNLSTSGLGFLTRHLFYAGQHLVIAHTLKESTPMLVLCRVCYCRSIEPGTFEVGLAFVLARPNPDDARNVPAEWLALVVRHD